MTKFNPHARHQARRLAMQALYQWEMADANPGHIEEEFLENQHYDMSRIDSDYFKELLQQITGDVEGIDQTIKPFLDRPLSELNPVELAIMRIGVYELARRQDIPYRVVINEALELAKAFGAAEGHKYVNGILDKVAQNLRKHEIQKNHEVKKSHGV